jgi:DNA-binding MarR family transcriptional regulator
MQYRTVLHLSHLLGLIGKVRDAIDSDIAQRLSISESTISRQVGRLVDLRALCIEPKGKTKEISITLTGRLLI